MNGRNRYLTGRVNRRSALAGALLAIVAAGGTCLAPATAPAAEENIVLDPRVAPIVDLPHGPFVRLADGGILGVREDSAIVSHDDGKTWEPRPIFSSGENFRIRPERAMLRTRAGTIILIFSNDAVLKYSWDKEKNGPLPDMHLPSYAIRSTDEGRTWGDLTLLDDGWCGCIQDILQTAGGNIIVPGQELLFEEGRHATMPYVSTDEGRSWQRTRYLDIGGRGDHAGAIEGTLEQLEDGKVRMLLRSYDGFFYDSFSADEGFTWTDPQPSSIRTTGSPGKMKRLASGRLVLLHNAIPTAGFVRREQLSICFSDDEGRTWSPPQVIATNKGGRVSYPHLFEHSPGVLWITTMQGGLRVSLQEADFIKDWTKIVCFGDSTTAPRGDLVVYADLLREKLSGRDIDIWIENSGIGSSHTEHARERFAQDVLDHRPKLAIIQFGINDSAVDVWKNPPATGPRVSLARYQENLNFFINTLRERNCRVILMTPNPLRWAEKTQKLYGRPPYDPNDPDGFNLPLKDYAAAVRRIATAQDVELVDVYALFESYDHQAGQSMEDLLLDGMHPNATGHRLIADLLMEKVDRLLASRPAKHSGPMPTPAQIEADWLRAALVRGVPVVHDDRPVTPEEDAVGACDGVRDGSWGMHTAREENPWWQIDLGRAVPLDEILIYNRCDGSADRAWNLSILLSQDGSEFTKVYEHDGTPFFGRPDNRPLAVNLQRQKGRYVRIQLPGKTCLHLDEVEIYQSRGHNLALRQPATQSSVCPQSTRSGPPAVEYQEYPTATVIERGRRLAEDLRQRNVDVDGELSALDQVDRRLQRLSADAGADDDLRQSLYLQAQWAVRRMAFSNPLLDFDDLVFVKRVPARFKTSRTSGTYTHMSDQYYGWFSRPGGGLYLLRGFKTDRPELRCLTEDFPPGNVIRPELSLDGGKVLFAWCKYYPELSEKLDKLDKSTIPEDAFYQLYEMNLDGSGLKRLTRGKYDSFDGRYLPSGEIVFLSTRRGQYIQCGKNSGMAAAEGALPDSYVRCGGDEYRPVAVYTLHVMDASGGNLRQISAFENFEWTPSVDHQGRILYARWDYVDRNAMPFMSLWSTMPDGTAPQALFGNYTRKPHAIFEARAIPNSRKIIFTASAHHSNTGGSLVLLDPNRGSDGEGPMTRLTPEVPFPEVEAWPKTYFVNPLPLSEEHYLVAWSDRPLERTGPPAEAADIGIYLFDAFGNLNLIYRDPEISCMYPLPVRRRSVPPVLSSPVDWDGPEEARMLVLDVYQGLESISRGTIRSLRIVGVPAKNHPVMNAPVLGVTQDDPGKFVMGTVPVEADGSAHFRVPSGVSFFLQVLDTEGMAVQTMRSATYLQPGQQYTCVGCHEPRNTAPANVTPLAASREPSKITPGVEGSWPLDFDMLVQPVMEQHCVRCHKPGTEGAAFDLTAGHLHQSLIYYGQPSLATRVMTRYRQGRSTAGECVARTSPLVKLLKGGHYEVQLADDDWQRLYTWLDTYGQRLGSFSEDQENRLRDLRRRMAAVLSE